MRPVNTPITFHRTASTTNETHATTTIVVTVELGRECERAYPSRSADGYPQCTACGLVARGPMGYCCGNHHCPFGMGPILC